MTSLDKIERRPSITADIADTSGQEFAVELTETLRLAVPIALTQLGQIAMMTTDLALIGRLGDVAVAAAALAHTVFFFSFTFGMGWSRPSRRWPRRALARAIRGRCGVRFASGCGLRW
jgi:MATE family, multidrug efflux pump